MGSLMKASGYLAEKQEQANQAHQILAIQEGFAKHLISHSREGITITAYLSAKPHSITVEEALENRLIGGEISLKDYNLLLLLCWNELFEKIGRAQTLAFSKIQK